VLTAAADATAAEAKANAAAVDAHAMAQAKVKSAEAAAQAEIDRLANEAQNDVALQAVEAKYSELLAVQDGNAADSVQVDQEEVQSMPALDTELKAEEAQQTVDALQGVEAKYAELLAAQTGSLAESENMEAHPKVQTAQEPQRSAVELATEEKDKAATVTPAVEAEVATPTTDAVQVKERQATTTKVHTHTKRVALQANKEQEIVATATNLQEREAASADLTGSTAEHHVKREAVVASTTAAVAVPAISLETPVEEWLELHGAAECASMFREEDIETLEDAAYVLQSEEDLAGLGVASDQIAQLWPAIVAAQNGDLGDLGAQVETKLPEEPAKTATATEAAGSAVETTRVEQPEIEAEDDDGELLSSAVSHDGELFNSALSHGDSKSQQPQGAEAPATDDAKAGGEDKKAQAGAHPESETEKEQQTVQDSPASSAAAAAAAATQPSSRRRYSVSLSQGALDDFLSVVDLPDDIAEEDIETLDVVCPEGVGPGDVIYVQYDDHEIEVKIPEGVQAGDDFEVDLESGKAESPQQISASVAASASEAAPAPEPDSVAEPMPVPKQEPASEPELEPEPELASSNAQLADPVFAELAFLMDDLADDDGPSGTDETLEVTVPEGSGPGDTISLDLPDGREIDVEIPAGHVAGDVFEVELDADDDELIQAAAAGHARALTTGSKPAVSQGPALSAASAVAAAVAAGTKPSASPSAARELERSISPNDEFSDSEWDEARAGDAVGHSRDTYSRRRDAQQADRADVKAVDPVDDDDGDDDDDDAAHPLSDLHSTVGRHREVLASEAAELAHRQEDGSPQLLSPHPLGDYRLAVTKERMENKAVIQELDTHATVDAMVARSESIATERVLETEQRTEALETKREQRRLAEELDPTGSTAPAPAPAPTPAPAPAAKIRGAKKTDFWASSDSDGDDGTPEKARKKTAAASSSSSQDVQLSLESGEPMVQDSGKVAAVANEEGGEDGALLRQVWTLADADGSGDLDADEILQVLLKMGHDKEDIDIEYTMSQILKGESERTTVDFAAFKRWFYQLDQVRCLACVCHPVPLHSLNCCPRCLN
jgi:hypothetical protein